MINVITDWLLWIVSSAGPFLGASDHWSVCVASGTLQPLRRPFFTTPSAQTEPTNVSAAQCRGRRQRRLS